MGFDNQLGAVERTLQAKIKDYEELLLLSGDANHAREVSSGIQGRETTDFHRVRERDTQWIFCFLASHLRDLRLN